MTDEELLDLLRQPESDRVERKASLADKDKICEAICAFANDLPDHGAPGVVFVGTHDDGSCADFEITDRRMQEAADLRSNGKIHPFPSMKVQRRALDGCELLAIVVEPSLAPPVRFRGRCWIRVGPRRAVATDEEERQLSEKRRHHNLPYDLYPVPEASVEDFDLDLFARTVLPAMVPAEQLERNHRGSDEQLAALRFLTADRSSPTVLGLLTLASSPRDHMPCAYLQFVRFDGEELTDPIRHQAEIDGPLPDLLRRLDEVLEANISVASRVAGSAVEQRHPDYPIEALRQLTRNAVLHRNYQGTNAPVRVSWFTDRIEIQSPGGPYGQVTTANFGQPGITDYRNPHLAAVMKELGYVQRFGLGIPLAQQELARNGNPPAELEAVASHVLVTLHGRPPDKAAPAPRGSDDG